MIDAQRIAEIRARCDEGDAVMMKSEIARPLCDYALAAMEAERDIVLAIKDVPHGQLTDGRTVIAKIHDRVWDSLARLRAARGAS